MKFTIAIPAYKAIYLKECINSVLAQTVNDFELIIVNDSSPEDIESIVSLYSDSRIRYYTNTINFGAEHVVDNWNKCLSYARGEYFVLLGDDDLLEKNYIEEFLKLIEKYPKCNVFHCRSIIMNDNSVSINLTDPRPEYESVYDSILQRILGKRTFYISDYVYRRVKLVENLGFYKLPLAWASDDISSYVAAIEHGIAHTNQLLFKYRQNLFSITSTGKYILKMEAILGEKKWLEEFLKIAPKSNQDSLLHSIIKNEIHKYIQKRKIHLLSMAISEKGFLTFLDWYKVRKKFSYSLEELFYAFILSFKEKRRSKYY